MEFKAFFLVVSLSLCCFALPANADPQAPTRVAFLSPDTSRFWQMVGGFMQAVADDLEIDLVIHTDREKHRYSYRELLENVLAQPARPDYILFMCKEKVTEDMLAMIGRAGSKAFTFNTAVPEGEAGQTGRPREIMSHWIGHVSPANRAAGATLIQELQRRYRKQAGVVPDMLIGLTGSRDSSAATHRNQGLEEVLREHPDVERQLLFANWNQRAAQDKVERLIERYPTIDLIWNASDGMALGAIAAAEAKGRTPGQDMLIGGMDWEDRALQEIENGRLALSLGRHFMGGGLALLLIHDYDAGYDFAEWGSVSMRYELAIADRDNLPAIRQVMDPVNWTQADFRRFSKHFNEERRPEPVSASGLLDDFMGALSPGFR